MFDQHVRMWRDWRYYNARVTHNGYTWDPLNPCLTLSYDV